MTHRIIVSLLVCLSFAPATFGKSIPIEQIALSASPDETEVKKYLDALREVVENDQVRVDSEKKRNKNSKPKLDPALMKEVDTRLDAAPTPYAELILKQAVKWHDDPLAKNFSKQLIGTLSRRKDYDAAQKDLFVKNLPKNPELIAVIDHMKWYDDAAIAAGWKQAKEDVNDDGIIGDTGSRYAVVAAKRGVTDAFVALAKALTSKN